MIVDVTFGTKGRLSAEVKGEHPIDVDIQTAELETPVQLLLGLQRFGAATPPLAIAYESLGVDPR